MTTINDLDLRRCSNCGGRIKKYPSGWRHVHFSEVDGSIRSTAFRCELFATPEETEQ